MRILICLLLISFSSIAQVGKFMPDIIVEYQFSFKPYITEETILTNRMCLLAKSDVSYFLDKKAVELDHQVHSLGLSVSPSDPSLQSKLATLPKPQIRGVIKKNLKNNIVQGNAIISRNYYYYEEQLNLKWSIKNETTNILGYSVKMATCTFKGRNYTAWFTDKIPLSDGPHKFCGLPGLILKLHDDKMDYSYEAIEIRKATPKDEMFFHLYSEPIKISKSEYQTFGRTEADNIIKNIESNPNISMSEETKRRILENLKLNNEKKKRVMEIED